MTTPAPQPQMALRAYLPGQPRPARRAGKSGVALVIVLAMLVLVTVLVIAFLSSVSTELQSSKSYASGSEARSLADSAVNIVISQIQDATTTPTLAWASQPGMIRTYNSAGAPQKAYKLYSSTSLQLPLQPAVDVLANLAADIPATWADPVNANLYTDLNRPVSTTTGAHYPILDPRAIAKAQGSVTALSGSGAPIEGCFINTTVPGSSAANPIPMPVQWIYSLKDGTVAAMDPLTKKIPGAGAPLPDGTTNTIVGRIAFWTDDESCKVNINTASEGTFWDRPWTRSTIDSNFDSSQPVQNEFQRFPGHPAMTSLSTVFPSLGGNAANNEIVYALTPRVTGGGSKSGTVLNTTTVLTNTGITPDTDRLFASVDEFLFSQPATAATTPRTENLTGSGGSALSNADIEKARFFITANSRSPEVNLFNKPRITLWPLQIDPDPVDGSKTRTAKDKLIAFCSTMGSQPYYFQRYNTYSFEKNVRPAGTDNWTNKQTKMPSSQSPTMDWTDVPRNRSLFAYLQSLTSSPIPGLGGSLADKYPNTRDQILVEMMDFIRSSVNPQRTLDNKVAAGADDLEYFYAPGYKRSTPQYYNVIGQQQVAPLIVKSGTYTGKGFGRFPSIKQAVLVIYASNPTQFRIKISPTGVKSADTALMNQNALDVKAVLLLDPFNVTPGHPVWCPNVRYKVSWVDAGGASSPCKINDVALDFPEPAINLITARDTELNQTATGSIEYMYKYYEKPASNDSDHSDLHKSLGIPVVGSPDEEQFYPFYTQTAITIPGVAAPGTPTLKFKGGSLKIEIYPGYSQALNPADCIQTIHMAFPSLPTPEVTLPRPSLESMVDPADSTNFIARSTTDFNERLKAKGLEPAGSHNLKRLIGPNDTVRSIEAIAGGPARGDYRVYAALPDVPATYFGSATGYDSVAIPRLHSLRIYNYNLNGNTTTLYLGFAKSRLGKLLSGVTYYDDPAGAGDEVFGNPIVPSELTSATMNSGIAGDWDTGPGNQVDGAYINKIDMGNNGKFTSYFSAGNNAQTFMNAENGATYSPNRQIASAVAFGSLPTGINPNNASTVEPWKTVLFCKNPAAGSAHPGFGSPLTGPPYTTAPDHAFLDLFTMPIVEPYAISEPFSTAGKINMNYQIVPFTYLTRSTGVRAVLKSTQMNAIPTADSAIYKPIVATNNYRYTISADEQTGTLKGFQTRFDQGDIFRSASEICDIFLVPKYLAGTTTAAPGSPTYASMESWWSTYMLTGDNLREGPYGHIYPRLTTKSNTYTVHVKTQALKKVPGTAANEFVEGRDQVTGEFRGSFVVQRYLDPNSDSLVKADGKTAPTELDADAMVGPYKFRVISSKRFAP